MGTSRSIVRPGLRTEPVAPGWRADIATTGATIRAHPSTIVLGMIGFALRGGIVLLTLPILILPTSVEVRLLLGNSLGSTGLTGAFYVLVAALSALTLLAAVGILYVLARCELSLFARFVNSHDPSAEHAWLPPGRLDQDHRSTLVRRLFVIEALALLAALLAAVPLAAAIGQATIQEIVLPSSTASIYVRIANDVSVAFVAWLAAVVVIEAVSALFLRRVLAGAFGLSAHSRMRRHPLRAVLVAVLGWVLFVGALAVSLVALSLAWDAVRFVFLSTGLSGDLRDIVSALLVALLFGTVFASVLVICGLVSSIRSGLWTLASLR